MSSTLDRKKNFLSAMQTPRTDRQKNGRRADTKRSLKALQGMKDWMPSQDGLPFKFINRAELVCYWGEEVQT